MARGNKASRKLRKEVGYTEELPDTCKTCRHFAAALDARMTTGEVFPPRCSLHQFHVSPMAICDFYTDAGRSHKPIVHRPIRRIV